jgi:hypothetical protein
MNAQQMVPSEYWCGPDRRPEDRPVITTGATRGHERHREWSTSLQMKRASVWPLSPDTGHAPTGGSLMPKVTVGRENSADIEIHYEDHGVG